MDDAKIDIKSLEVTDSSVLLVRYDSTASLEDVQESIDLLKEEFPNNKVLAITNDMELLESNADDAVAMLERMIAHIKLVKDLKPKIVLT